MQIEIRLGDVNVFVATHQRNAKGTLEGRRKALAAGEAALGFDPARNKADLDQLKAILEN